MAMFGQTAAEQADALERAADMALEDGDTEHAKALREAALFKRRIARERAAGFKGLSPMAFDKI